MVFLGADGMVQSRVPGKEALAQYDLILLLSTSTISQTVLQAGKLVSIIEMSF